MNTYPENTPPPVGPLALTQRQLSDWKILLNELTATGAAEAQLQYCEKQIARLTAEVQALSADDSDTL